VTSAADQVTALHINPDGLLHVLSLLGLEMQDLPPVLALTPNAFYEEDVAAVTEAIVPILTDRGIISGSRVTPSVQQLINVLSDAERRMDLMCTAGSARLRMCLARTGEDHVLASRHDQDIVIHPLATAGQPFPVFATAAVSAALGPASIPAFPSQSFRAEDLTRVAGPAAPGAEYAAALVSLGGDRRAAATIAEVAQTETRRTTIGLAERTPTGLFAPAVAVTIHDSDRGRIVTSVTRTSSGDRWVSITPGSEVEIRSAMRDLETFFRSKAWYSLARRDAHLK
jgi:hypothetical protein